MPRDRLAFTIGVGAQVHVRRAGQLLQAGHHLLAIALHLIVGFELGRVADMQSALRRQITDMAEARFHAPLRPQD